MSTEVYTHLLELVKREHSGDNLDDKIPIEYAKEIMPKLSTNIALFPPIVLDNITCNSKWRSGKDVKEKTNLRE